MLAAGPPTNESHIHVGALGTVEVANGNLRRIDIDEAVEPRDGFVFGGVGELDGAGVLPTNPADGAGAEAVVGALEGAIGNGQGDGGSHGLQWRLR